MNGRGSSWGGSQSRSDGATEEAAALREERANGTERDDIVAAHFLIKGSGDDEGGAQTGGDQVAFAHEAAQCVFSSLGTEEPPADPLTEHRCRWAVSRHRQQSVDVQEKVKETTPKQTEPTFSMFYFFF